MKVSYYLTTSDLPFCLLSDVKVSVFSMTTALLFPLRAPNTKKSICKCEVGHFITHKCGDTELLHSPRHSK